MTHSALGTLLTLLAVTVGTILAMTVYSAFSNDLPADLQQYQPERSAP